MKIQATTFKRFCFTGLALTAAAALVFTGASRLHDWVQISPVAAQVTTVNPWTAIGASGVADETDFAPIPLFAFTNASAGYGANASLAQLEFRYNVVNVEHRVSATGGLPTETSPAWTILEFGAQAPATSTASAFLYKVSRCTGQQTLICSVRQTNQPAPGTCKMCQFANTTFDFANNLYYVRVLLTRDASTEQPMANTLRIY
jgi:hypothetical protein